MLELKQGTALLCIHYFNYSPAIGLSKQASLNDLTGESEQPNTRHPHQPHPTVSGTPTAAVIIRNRFKCVSSLTASTRAPDKSCEWSGVHHSTGGTGSEHAQLAD